jgi:hypothetical protein
LSHWSILHHCCTARCRNSCTWLWATCHTIRGSVATLQLPRGRHPLMLLLTSSVWGLSRPVSYPAIAETRGNDTVEGVDVAQEERVDGAVATGRLLPASCPKGRRAFHQDLRSHSRSWIKRIRSPSARRTHGAKAASVPPGVVSRELSLGLEIQVLD